MVRETTRGAFRSSVLDGTAVRAHIGAAANLTNISGNITKPIKPQTWEAQAWSMYRAVLELHYGVQWVGNLMSKAKIIVRKAGTIIDDPGDPAVQLLADFFGGPDQHTEFLRQAAIHMTVAGEYYICGWDVDGEDVWRVVAATKISYSGGQWKIVGDDKFSNPLLVMRTWRPDPEEGRFSDSPVRSALPVLSQIDTLTKNVSAQADSRLLGAGLLLLPSEVTVGTVPTQDNPDGTVQQISEPTELIKIIAETMALAKKNPESASAKVPVILQMAGEYIDKVQLIDFWSKLDENAKVLREDAIRTLATGLDTPPEVLLGNADSNHWNAWLTDESGIKVHSEPLAAIIMASLTRGHVQPSLKAQGVEDYTDYTWDVDTSQMRLPPDKSESAFELWDRGELSSEALRRENGFDETDAPVAADLTNWLLKKVAAGSATPGMVLAAIKELGVKLEVTQDDVEEAGIQRDTSAITTRIEDDGTGDMREARPNPSLNGHPTRQPPQLENAQVAALVAASEVMVFRALERAGNKLKTKFRDRPEDVATRDLYLYLPLTEDDITDAIAGSLDGIGQFTSTLDVDKQMLTQSLRGYLSTLMTSRTEHDPGLMRRHLARAEQT